MWVPLLCMVWHYKRQYTDKTLTLRKSYECVSELKFCSYFHSLNLLFPSIFCWYFMILCLRNIYMFRSQITSAYYIYNTVNAVSFHCLWYGAMTVYRQNTNIEKINVYASERSERVLKCPHFTYSQTAI